MSSPDASLLRRIGALAGGFSLCTVLAPAQDLELHFVDIGQGNCTLIRTPEGNNVLVDGGFAGEGTGTIVPYLSSIGVTELDYSVATHWDADHIGGMDEVFNAGFLPTIAAYDRGDFNRPTNGHVTGYLAAVGSRRRQPSVGFTVFIGAGVTMEFVVENGNHPGGSIDAWTGTQGENSASIGFVLHYGEFDAWLGGDLTGGGNGTVDVESLVAPHVGPVELVLVNHHGSNTSSNPFFTTTLDPSLAVFQCGRDNPYGHPTTTVMDRWNPTSASRVQWCTTAGDTTNGAGGFMVADGHFVVRTDGWTFSVARAGAEPVVRLAAHELGAAPVGPGELVISEVHVDPVASPDMTGEWIELVGRSPSPRDLRGVRFQSGTDFYTLRSRVLMGTGDRFVFGQDGRGSRTGDVLPAHAAPWPDFEMPNGTSSLTLTDASGELVETVQWGAGGFSLTPGVSKERIDLAAPATPANFADALTAWAGGDLGTPGERNGNEIDSGCDPASVYCVGAPNSAGPGARISHTGTLDLDLDDLVLTCDGLPPGQFGIFFYGSNPIQIPFGDGFRCVGGQLFRLLPPLLSDGAGSVERPVDLANPPQEAGRILDGSTWRFQFWYRDPAAGGAGFNLSDGLAATFCRGGV